MSEVALYAPQFVARNLPRGCSFSPSLPSPPFSLSLPHAFSASNLGKRFHVKGGARPSQLTEEFCY